MWPLGLFFFFLSFLLVNVMVRILKIVPPHFFNPATFMWAAHLHRVNIADETGSIVTPSGTITALGIKVQNVLKAGLS
jgi:hypothetical protein